MNTSLTFELYQLLPKSLTQDQHCVHCGVIFKECENIGQHLCRIHPGIRLVAKNGQAFYSCCGRPASSQSPWANACLEWDHHCLYLSESNAEMRLSQILDASTMIVPHLLLRFITPPLKCSLVYDSRGKDIDECPLFRLALPALSLVEQRNACLNTRYAPQIVIYQNKEEEMPCPIDYALSFKEFNLREEADILWQKAKDSPFFAKFIQKNAQSQQTIQERCDAIWRTNLTRSESSEKEDCQEISFVIVARIANQLNSGLLI